MTPDASRDLLIGWSLLPFLSSKRTHLLLEYFDPPAAAAAAPVDMLASLLNIPRHDARRVKEPLQLPETARCVEALRQSALTFVDDDYPPLLREIYDPPFALFIRGDRSLLSRPSIAVVGSRLASAYGVNAAREISRQLTSAGVIVVSGMARGIDAAAHRAALEHGGPTIAVLGTGLDVVYPRTHARLAEEIAERGALVTQFLPGTPPLAPNFPIRNRIISGLSLGTIIVEATSRSGSLITARMAAEQGREVFAVPGSIFSRASEGPHRLVQYGAKLLHEIDDVFSELPAIRPASPAGHSVQKIDPLLASTLEAFSYDEPVHIDKAAERLKTSTALLADHLLQLELLGLLRPLPGARYVRAK
ncbi:MAG TPA: DNA-processing protein DprA [Thermoanaerobaculia bacterium]|nr:DNA-processing protein DprA [Thermoanaerobaculia bacterium]